MLSTYGVPNIIVTKYSWLADTPRAHITNQRTMEILRDLGVEAEVTAEASPQDLMGNTVFCTSLAGEELGRLRAWGTDPRRRADYMLASPSAICDMPQNLLEPILLGAAAARGTKVRFDNEYLSCQQDAEGVTADVKDRASGVVYQIRAKYLLGADGVRSRVAEDAGLTMEGKMGVAGSINILFRADQSGCTRETSSMISEPGNSDVTAHLRSGRLVECAGHLVIEIRGRAGGAGGNRTLGKGFADLYLLELTASKSMSHWHEPVAWSAFGPLRRKGTAAHSPKRISKVRVDE